MPFVISLSILVGLVSLLNLVLTIGLVKRIRDQDERIATITRGEPELLDIGERVDDFTTTTVDGEALSRDLLGGGTLVGFFDPTCETCHEHLPKWAAQARRLPDGRVQALAVVREDPEVHEMVSVLNPVARVVVERRRGPVAKAFHVKATPAFCRLGDDQVVSAHDYEPNLTAAAYA
jgi:hypothetical protein